MTVYSAMDLFLQHLTQAQTRIADIRIICSTNAQRIDAGQVQIVTFTLYLVTCEAADPMFSVEGANPSREEPH